MGGPGDRREVVGALDLTLGDAGGVQELALDLGQGSRIVAEELDGLVASVRRGGSLGHGHAAAPFSQTSRVAFSCSMPMGLVMKPSMPTSRLFCSSPSSVLAVTARIGVRGRCSAASLARMRRANSKPSIGGICRSARTQS